MFRIRTTPRRLRTLLKQASALELSACAVRKLKWFLFALEHDGNISLTCRHFGIARSTFVRWAKRFSPRDPLSLEEASRRPRRVREPETPAHIVGLIRQLRTEHVLLSKQEVASRLRAQWGISVSASTVGRVIARHGLFFAQTPCHREKRRAHPSASPQDAAAFPSFPRLMPGFSA